MQDHGSVFLQNKQFLGISEITVPSFYFSDELLLIVNKDEKISLWPNFKVHTHG